MNPQPLEVLPYDGVFRCLVRSEKNPKRVYLVDLEANDGIGFCGCTDFRTRKHPAIDKLSPKERRVSGNVFRCKHIRVARRLRASQLLDEIMKQRAEQKRCS